MYLRVKAIILVFMLLIIPFISLMPDGFIQTVKGEEARTTDSDNSFDAATLISSPGKYTGSVNFTDDIVDVFKVFLSANSTEGDLMFVNLTITDPLGLIALNIFTPEKYPIFSDICHALSFPYLNWSICAIYPGNYYISIVNPFEECNYEFEINWSSVSRTVDSDNTNSTATTAASSSVFQDDLNPVYDYIDIYNLTVTSGTTKTEGVIVELYNYSFQALEVYRPDGHSYYYKDIISSSNN